MKTVKEEKYVFEVPVTDLRGAISSGTMTLTDKATADWLQYLIEHAEKDKK